LAELLLKVGDGAGYVDGDCLCAFTDHRISCCHAEMICHPGKAVLTGVGLRDNTAVARDYLDTVYQYRFERVNRTQVKRIALATMTEEIFGPESMDVDLYIKRRLRHGRHRIFGTVGAEVWHGGRQEKSPAKMAQVWNAIETKTPLRKADHNLWPMGRLDVKHHLAIRASDMTEEESNGMVDPQLDWDAEGKSRLDADGKDVQLARRNIHIEWRDLVSDIGVSVDSVLNRDVTVGGTKQIPNGMMQITSKEQPIQTDRKRLLSKYRGGSIL